MFESIQPVQVPMRSRLVRGAFWVVSARLFTIFLVFSINALLARLLPPVDMGTYFLAMSILGLCVAFGQLGLPQVVIRLVAEAMSHERMGRARQVVRRAILLSSVGSVGVSLLFYFGFPELSVLHAFHIEPEIPIISLISILIVVTSLNGVTSEAYRGFHDMRGASIFGSVLQPTFLAGLLAIIWFTQGEATLENILSLTVVSTLATAMLSIGFLHKKLKTLGDASAADYSELLRIGWPLCMAQAAIFLMNQADLWIVGAALTKEETAIYGVMQKMLALMTMSHSLVITVAQSTVAELYAKREMGKLQGLLQGTALAATVPAALLLIFFIVFGQDVVKILFGPFYIKAYEPLLILGASHFVGMLLGPTGMALAMTGHQKPLMLATVGTGLATTALAAVFAFRFGLLGVAVAWGVGVIAYGLLTWWLALKLVGVATNAKPPTALISWRRK